MRFAKSTVQRVVSGYATWNPSDKGANITLSGGNLTCSSLPVSNKVRSTIGKSSGKWFWEITPQTSVTGPIIGISTSVPSTTTYPGQDLGSWGYYGVNGNKFNNGSAAAYGATYALGAVIGVALDMTAGTVTFYNNGVSQGVAFTGLSGTVFATWGNSAGGATSGCTANFGASAFVYTVPAGFNPGLF